MNYCYTKELARLYKLTIYVTKHYAIKFAILCPPPYVYNRFATWHRYLCSFNQLREASKYVVDYRCFMLLHCETRKMFIKSWKPSYKKVYTFNDAFSASDSSFPFPVELSYPNNKVLSPVDFRCLQNWCALECDCVIAKVWIKPLALFHLTEP